MYTLVITCDDAKVDEVPVREQWLRIGRKADNDVRISEPTVSAHHARVRLHDGNLYLEDLSSTNGTYVNGRRVTAQPLHEGDLIMIGKYKLIVRGADGTETAPLPDETMELSRSEIERLLADMNSGASTQAAHPERNRINWVAQDSSGVWWGFDRKPVAGDDDWQVTGKGRSTRLKQGSPSSGWRETLRRV